MTCRLTMREEAIKDLHSSVHKFAKAGCLQDFMEIAWRESDVVKGDMLYQDADDEVYVDCAICDGGHEITLYVKKPKPHSYQYCLEVVLQYDWSRVGLWQRIKSGVRSFWKIIRGKSEQHDICIGHGDSMTKIRDFFRRIDENEREKAVEENN